MVQSHSNAAKTKKRDQEGSIIDFDSLPDVALITDKARRKIKLTGLSISTEDRRCEEGRFPRKVKISNKVIARNVGELRKWLANPEEYTATTQIIEHNSRGNK